MPEFSPFLRRNYAGARALLAVATCVVGSAALASARVPLIIDTDTATDCDDAGALAVAHALQNRGECVILAVIVNNKDPYSVGAVDAVNTWYGRGNIPLGAYKGTTVGKTGSYQAIAENTALYRHDVVTSAQVPEAVTTYRTVLAARPDASVVIASIGWLNNLEGLLKSPADAISPLTGTGLVAAKVKSISIMGGRYPSGSEYNFTSFGSPPSTKYVVENWPDNVPMMFQGYELGENVTTGPSQLNTPAENPVRKAYETIYNGINGRHSWDQCAVLHAVRGLADYWTAVTVGSNTINTDGTNAWVASPDKNQAYSVASMPKPQLTAIIADLMDDPPLPPTSHFPVKVIFDTDYSTDCDDPGALAVLHALADNGEAEILATGASTSRAKAPGAIDVVNTYYGRPNIPIAATKVGPSYNSAYTDYLYDNFPRDTPLSSAVEDAVTSYRRILAAQPNDSVVFITVGYLTNMSELLKSPADAISPLTGMQLVAAKVREWACMGGNFWTNSTDNVNFSRDAASAQYAIANFPRKLTFLPREVASVPSPLRAGEVLNETPLTNPVRIAYHKYFGRTTNINQHCADLATVLYAVRGTHDYWDLHSTGSMITVNTDGTFTWNESVEKDHNYLVMKGGYGVYSNKTYLEGVLRNLLKQTPAVVVGVHAPVITGHPQNASISPGEIASFSVVATANPPPTYQWQKNGTAIPGATGAVYTTPAATAADNGAAYRVMITNAEGTTISNDSTLTVNITLSGGLIARYAFDETSGPIINQGTAGAAPDLTNTGGPTGRDNTGPGGYGAQAYQGYGAAFDVLASGNNLYHTSTSSVGGGLLTSAGVLQSDLQSADGAFTYEAFVSLSTAAGEQTILSHDGAVTRGFLLRVIDGTLSFYNGTTSFAASLPTSGAHAFSANQWFHVAVTYSGQAGVAGNLKFYWTALNVSPSEANLVGTATLGTDLDGSASNLLGIGTTTRNYFRYETRGLVDEVRLHAIEVAANDFAAFTLPPGADTSGDGIPDTWAIAHGFNPGLNIAQGDPDSDGIRNLMEFALNLDPRSSDTDGLPIIGLVGGHLTIIVSRNPNAGHLQFIPEISSDLETWQSGQDYLTIVEDSPSTLTASDKQPDSGSSHRFMRLHVVANSQT